jgi:hypothetical protein
MIFDANDFGSSAFAENFSSLRQEKQARDEALELERIAALLERLANQEEAERAERESAARPRKKNGLLPRELLRIESNGDIAADDRRQSGVDRNKVHTLDDLPKESLYESLFPEENLDDALKVESGRRLRDGKIYHHAYYDDPINGKTSILEWTGLSFDSLVILGAVALFLLMLMVRLLLGWFFSGSMFARNRRDRTEADIELLVQKSLENRLAIIQARAFPVAPSAFPPPVPPAAAS